MISWRSVCGEMGTPTDNVTPSGSDASVSRYTFDPRSVQLTTDTGDHRDVDSFHAITAGRSTGGAPPGAVTSIVRPGRFVAVIAAPDAWKNGHGSESVQPVFAPFGRSRRPSTSVGTGTAVVATV